MYGDSGVMRKRAAQLREQAGDIRALADHLVAQTEGVAWTGRAADAMRERVRDRAAHLRDVRRGARDAPPTPSNATSTRWTSQGADQPVPSARPRSSSPTPAPGRADRRRTTTPTASTAPPTDEDQP